MAAAIVNWLAVVVITICCVQYTTEQRIVGVGSEIKSSRAGFAGAGATFLLTASAHREGRLFAFAAFFRNLGKVRFQMWRPETAANATTMFRLISETPMIPSVDFGREVLYIESLLKTDECIHVKRGDHFGVYLEEAPGAIARSFNQDAKVLTYTLQNTTILTKVGDMVEFDSLTFPYDFSMTAFLDTEIANETSDPQTNFMPCPIGLRVPEYTPATLPPTVATPPPTGAPGATGPQGPRGATGEVGPAGPHGPIGPPGEKGEIGPVGPDGPAGVNGSDGDDGNDGADGVQGETGDIGEPGDMGPRGFNGSAGAKGDRGEKGETGDKGEEGKKGETGETGEKGDKGETGERGPAGEQGTPGNSAAAASSDAKEYFWEDWEALAIWLLVVSVVVIIMFFILICVVCGMSRKRRNKSHRYDYDEYMSRHEATTPAATIPPYENVNADWVNSMRADEYKDMHVDTITRDGGRRNVDQNPSSGDPYATGTNRSSNGAHTNPGLVSADELMNY